MQIMVVERRECVGVEMMYFCLIFLYDLPRYHLNQLEMHCH